MLEKHNKLTLSEFLHNVWTDCADSMTGRFSAPFLIIGFLAATWLAIKYDFTWLLILSAVIYSTYRQVERERNALIDLENKIDNREERQGSINKLWKLREYGSDLRNRHAEVKTEDDYKKWKAEYEQWRVDILREADVVHPNLQSWNHTVNVMAIHKIPNFASTYDLYLFKVDYWVIGENLNRVEEYLKRELFLEQETYFR